MEPSSPPSPVTSPARKLIPPSKTYVPIQPAPPKASDWKYAAIPQAKPVVHQNTSNHMLARKRSYDAIQQNGIDGKSVVGCVSDGDWDGSDVYYQDCALLLVGGGGGGSCDISVW